ncbi:MAG: hypothetical protein ACI9Y7_002515 [Dokdonia sp.]|jgi:hypothetical protein
MTELRILNVYILFYLQIQLVISIYLASIIQRQINLKEKLKRYSSLGIKPEKRVETKNADCHATISIFYIIYTCLIIYETRRNTEGSSLTYRYINIRFLFLELQNVG